MVFFGYQSRRRLRFVGVVISYSNNNPIEHRMEGGDTSILRILRTVTLPSGIFGISLQFPV